MDIPFRLADMFQQPPEGWLSLFSEVKATSSASATEKPDPSFRIPIEANALVDYTNLLKELKDFFGFQQFHFSGADGKFSASVPSQELYQFGFANPLSLQDVLLIQVHIEKRDAILKYTWSSKTVSPAKRCKEAPLSVKRAFNLFYDSKLQRSRFY